MMQDVEGKEVEIGDVVTLIHISPDFLEKLPDDERPLLEGLLNKDHEIKELVENDSRAGIYYEQECDEGVRCGTLYVEPTDIKFIKMSRKKRLRRVALLCIHFTRNLAYSRVIHSTVEGKKEGDFWLTMQGNCLDTAVLEWCKLFGEKKGKHSWNNIVDEPNEFKEGLLKELNITEDLWESCWRELRAYRDTFVAHLDSEKTMNLPTMDLPFDMVKYYFNTIMGYENEDSIFNGIPRDLNNYFLEKCDEAASKAKT